MAAQRPGLTQALGAVTDHRKNEIGKIYGQGVSEEQFVHAASAISWYHSAQPLHRAANVLVSQVSKDWQRLEQLAESSQDSSVTHPPDLFRQFFLLAAFALENILKGVVVGAEPQLAQGGKLQGILTSHDLVAIAQRAKIPLSPEESRFCELASSASVSWGRYPASVKANQHVSSLSITGSSVQVFNDLYSRISGHFFEHIKAAKGSST